MRSMNRRPTLPGEILSEHFLGERGIPIGRFAEETGLHRKTVSAVLHGRARITAETAVRFSRVLDTTPEFWLNLQNAVDIFEARRKLVASA
jgi:addiction module HigA family antidote